MIRLVVIVKIYNLENGFDSNRSPAPFCRYLFFFVNMFLSKLKHMHKKKPCIYKASSYCRGGRIRTCDLLVPNEAR